MSIRNILKVLALSAALSIGFAGYSLADDAPEGSAPPAGEETPPVDTAPPEDGKAGDTGEESPGDAAE